MDEPTFWGNKIDEDPDEATSFVRGLIRGDPLEEAALGVAKQFADGGYGSLSEKQKRVLEIVLDEYGTKACVRCAQPIPWSEMDGAYHNARNCAWCQHQSEKLLRE